MAEPIDSDTAVDSPWRLQFSLQTFAGLFVVVALLLGYLRLFGVESVAKCAVLTAVALVLGGLVGARAGKLGDALFWSAIGAVFGFLAILGDVSYHWILPYAWPLVGGLTGATAAICPDGRLARRMMCCALVAWALISVCFVLAITFQPVMLADLLCAALGGALMAVAVEMAGRFERYTSLPRHLLATGFVLVGITGHWLAFHYAKSVYWWLRG